MRGDGIEEEQRYPKKRRTRFETAALEQAGVDLADRGSQAQGEPEEAIRGDGETSSR